MKKALLLLTLFMLSLASPMVGSGWAETTGDDPAEEGAMTVLHTAVNPANNHTYHLLTAASWEDSASYARSMGGFLVTVDDAVEDVWLFDTFASWDNQSRHLWTGLNDANDDGVYKWHDGTPFLYRNWGESQPSEGGDEDYVHIASTNMGNIMPGTWNDLENDPQYFPVYGVVEVGPGADFSLRFNGEGDHIVVDHDDNLTVEGNLSLSAWVYPYSDEGLQFIMMKGDYGWGMYLKDGHLAYASEYSLSRHPSSNLTVDTNAWNHVTVTVEAGVGGHFTINGMEAGNITAEEAMIPAGDFGSNDCYTNGEACDEFYIGRMGAGCDCNFFGGLMDNVSVNGNLSEWAFPEGEGATTVDNTGRVGSILGADWVMPDGSIVAQAVELFQNEDYVVEELLEGSTYLFFTDIEPYTRYLYWNAYSFWGEGEFENSFDVYVGFNRIPSEWDHDDTINTEWGWSWGEWTWPDEGTMWFVLVPNTDVYEFNIFLQSDVADPPPTLDEMTELRESIAVTNQDVEGDRDWNGDVGANYYYVNVTSPLADLRIQTYGGRGDVDLAISSYSPPDPNNGWGWDGDIIGFLDPVEENPDGSTDDPAIMEDWSTGPDNNEEVHLFDVEPGIYYITAYSWRNARGFTIVADFVYPPENVEPADALTLTPGVEYGLLSGYDGLSQYFKVDVTTGTERLVVELSDGNGEASLYMRYDQAPTTSTYDHHSTMEGADDRIAFNDPTPGWWYILLTSESAFTGVNIVAQFADRYVWDYDGTPIELYNEERLDGISVPQGETVSFFSTLEEPGNVLQVQTSGGSGDIQIEVSGLQYEFEFFDFFPDIGVDEGPNGRQGFPDLEVQTQEVALTSGRSGTNHLVTLDFPMNGRFDIVVTGISDAEEFSIVAMWDRSDFPIDPVDPVEPEQPSSTTNCAERAQAGFEALDRDDSGLIEERERQNIDITGWDVDDVDMNGDGAVEYREFLQAMCTCETELQDTFDILADGQEDVAAAVLEGHAWVNPVNLDLLDVDDDPERVSDVEWTLVVAVCETTFDAFDGDGDGVPDDDDAFPDDPTESQDTDGDGVGDNADFAASVSNDVIYTSVGVVFGLLVIALLGMFVRSGRNDEVMMSEKSWDDEVRLQQAINAPSMTDLPTLADSTPAEAPLVDPMTAAASPYVAVSEPFFDAMGGQTGAELMADLSGTSPVATDAPDASLMGMILDGMETVEYPPQSGQLWVRADPDAPWSPKQEF